MSGSWLPLTMALQPIESLVVIDLDGHPDVVSIEIQRLTGDAGLRVLWMRRDGLLEVATQAGAGAPAPVARVGKGLARSATVALDAARFDTSDGLDVEVAVPDSSGRLWEVVVRAPAPPAGRSPFLAPVGAGVEHPDRLFAVQMVDFALIGVRSNVQVRVDGTAIAITRLPRAVAPTGVYLARWAPEVVVADLLPDGGTADETTVESSSGSVNFRTGQGRRSAALEFVDGLPRSADWPEGDSDWPFRFVVAGACVASGVLKVRRVVDQVDLAIDVTRGWSPSRIGALARLVATLQPQMRSWPTTYRWEGGLDLAAPEDLTSSRWSRTGGGQ